MNAHRRLLPDTALAAPLLLLPLLLLLLLLATGCLDNSPEPRLGGDGTIADGGGDGSGTRGDATVDSVAPDSEPHIDAALAPLAALRDVDEGRFATSLSCAGCHKNTTMSTAMRDAQQRPVAMYDLWRATAMANAGRDPFWRAAVAAEVEFAPALKATIEETCMRCHSPMAYTEAKLNTETPVAMTLLDGDTARSQLVLDGGWRFRPGWALFLRADLGERLFFNELPVTYNSSTAGRFGSRLSLLTAGLRAQF